MKRLLSAFVAGTLALTAVGATAASAQSWGGRHHGGYSRGWNGHRGDNTGALVGLGISLFALGAIAAASSNRDRYYDRYDYGPPPPPPPAYRYGYGYRY